jgi:hypothetical protein
MGAPVQKRHTSPKNARLTPVALSVLVARFWKHAFPARLLPGRFFCVKDTPKNPDDQPVQAHSLERANKVAQIAPRERPPAAMFGANVDDS